MEGNEKIRGALAYLLGFLTGIFFLLTEKKSEFIRFHAMQSTITFASLFIIQIILGFIPFFGALLKPFVSLLGFVLWLMLIWKAHKGEKYHLPYIGKIAQEQLKKL